MIATDLCFGQLVSSERRREASECLQLGSTSIVLVFDFLGAVPPGVIIQARRRLHRSGLSNW
jgi:hypothetical protein